MFLASFGESDIQWVKKSAVSALSLDHRPIAFLNIDCILFAKIISFRVRPMLSHLCLPVQVGYVPQRSIHTSLFILKAVHKAATLDSNIDRELVPLLDFAKVYDTFQRPYILSTLT